MLPSGTGTTAFYVQKYLPFEVLTCACVGGPDYLQKQFTDLGDTERYPSILPASRASDGHVKAYHFGKLYPEFFEIWQELREETGITFELLYDPLGWLCMLEYLENLGVEANLIYLHQGGLQGNASMLKRYGRQKESDVLKKVTPP